MITVFHIGPQGFNIGNEAIQIGTRWLLQKAFGQVVNVISIPATSRFETHGRSGLKAGIVHEINQLADGVIIGGGNLYENGQLVVDLSALEVLQPPLMLYSLSWGRIYNREGKLVPRTDRMPEPVMRALNDKAHLSLARDRATVAYLHSLGAVQAELGGCPTVFVDETIQDLPDLPSSDVGGSLVSIRHPELMNIPLTLRARIHGDITRLLGWLRDHGYEPVRLLCHDHRDIPFAVGFESVDWVYTDDVRTYLSLLRACDLSIGYRLHAALPCAALGTPFITISYDERSLSLMETMGLEKWNIDLVRSDDLFADLEAREGDLGRLDELLETSWREARQELAATAERAFKDFADAVADHAASRSRS